MHNLLKKMDLAKYGVVELRIASAEDPIEIVRDEFLTILTGSVDYSFFFRCEPNDWPEALSLRHSGLEPAGVKRILRQIQITWSKIPFTQSEGLRRPNLPDWSKKQRVFASSGDMYAPDGCRMYCNVSWISSPVRWAAHQFHLLSMKSSRWAACACLRRFRSTKLIFS